MNEKTITITSMVISIPCELLTECLKSRHQTSEKWEARGYLGDSIKGEESFQIETVLNNSKKTVQLTLSGSNMVISKESTELKITSVHRLGSNVIDISPITSSEHLPTHDFEVEATAKLCPMNTQDPHLGNTSTCAEIQIDKPKAKRGRKPKLKLPQTLPENEENSNIVGGDGGRRKYGLRGVKLSSAIMDAVKGHTFSDDSDLGTDFDSTEDYIDRTSLKCDAEAQTDYDVEEDSLVENLPIKRTPGTSYTRHMMKNKYKVRSRVNRSLKILKIFKNSSLAKDQRVDRNKVLAALEDVYSSNRRRKCVAKSATCQYCEKRYCDFSGVDIHVRKFHMREKDVDKYLDTLVPLKQMTCSICSAILPNRLQLQVHEDREHSKVISQCAICGKSFRNLQFLRNHIKLIHLSDETHLCHLCSATFKHAVTLKQHIEEIHEQQRNCTCSYCGKTFYRKAQLNRHSRIHDANGKKLICQVCGKEFNYECNLQRHVKVVHAPKSENFHCCYCGRGFYQKPTLSAHIQKVHFNLCPFSCAICTATFMRSKHIEDHMAQVHNNPDFKVANPREKLLKYNRCETDLFTCSYCQETFSYKSSLVDHVQTTHSDIFPHHCNLCQQAFLESEFLVRHQEKAHDVPPPLVWPDDDEQLMEVHLSNDTKQVTIVPFHALNDQTSTVDIEGTCIDTSDARDNDMLAVLASSSGMETVAIGQEEEELATAGSVLVEISNDDSTIRYVIQGGEDIDMDSSNAVVHDIASLLIAAEQSLHNNSEVLQLENVDGPVAVEVETESVVTSDLTALTDAEGNVAVCRIDDDSENFTTASSVGMEEITVIMQE